MSTWQESRDTECKYIMRCKRFNHLKHISRTKDYMLVLHYYYTRQTIMYHDWFLIRELNLGILHQVKLRQYWNSFYVRTKSPKNPAEAKMLCVRVNKHRKNSRRHYLKNKWKYKMWLLGLHKLSMYSNLTPPNL